jgi:hypothetical protein
VTSDALAVIDYEAVFHPLEISTQKRKPIILVLRRKRGARCWGQTSCHSYKIVILSAAEGPLLPLHIFGWVGVLRFAQDDRI